jgi:hypothetical protein
MLVGKQVALIGNWLAEAKCHANSAVPHFLKGRPNTIYYFTVSCEVFRSSIIHRPFREADCLSQLKEVPTSGLLKKPDRLQHNLFQRSKPVKLAAYRAIDDCCNC